MDNRSIQIAIWGWPSLYEIGLLRMQKSIIIRDGFKAIYDFILTKQGWFKEHKAPLFFTGSSLLTALAQMISGICMIRWINPEELGLWNSLRLALTYSFFLLVGIINGLSRELPFYLGNNDIGSAEKLASTALFNTVVACLVAMLGGIICFSVFSYLGENITFGIIAIILLIIFAFYRNYLTVTFRSKNSFNDLAAVQFWEALLMILTIPLFYYFFYKGLLIRTVIVSGVVLFLLHRVRPIKVSPEWEWQSFKLLIVTGAPIFLLDYICSSAATFDRLALLQFRGVKHVGLYTLALTAFDTFSVIHISLAQYLYPRMTYIYGKHNDPRILWTMAWQSMILIVVIMLPFTFLGWFLLPPVVETFFPKYVEGIEAAQIMLFAAVVTGAGIGVNALWSMKIWRSMITYQMILSGLLVIGPYLGIMLYSSSLIGVAYGMFWARLIAFALGLWLTYIATHRLIPVKGDGN